MPNSWQENESIPAFERMMAGAPFNLSATLRNQDELQRIDHAAPFPTESAIFGVIKGRVSLSWENAGTPQGCDVQSPCRLARASREIFE